MRRHPTPFQLRTLWNAATGVAIAVLGLLLTLIIWLVGKALGFLQPVIVPLAVAGIIAYLLDPVVRWFQKRGLTRLRAVIATFGAFLALGAALVALTIPLVGNQINAFRANSPSLTPASEEVIPKNAPFEQRIVTNLIVVRSDYSWTRPVIDTLLSAPESAEKTAPPAADAGAPPRETLTQQLNEYSASRQAAKNAGEDLPEPPTLDFYDTSMWSYLKDLNDDALRWIKGGTGKVLGFLGLILGFVMTPIYLYFFLKDSASIREHWHEYVPLKASRFKTEVIETLTEINGYMISFFRGQVLVAFIDGLFIGIGLTLFGLPLGILFGVMMAIVGIIPFVGNILTLIPACLLAFFHYSDPSHASIVGDNPWANVAAVCAIFFLAQQVNSMFTAPKIVGDSVGLHPMTVIFSMIFWSLILGGFVGALLAVPLTASIKVLFRRYIWEKTLRNPPPDSSTVGDPGDLDPDPV
ncbi:AI-2E family transporter [Haloferula sargassicola]|uniref:AI-2E family transporter n=1 Tax=Haloferula sargassicola TaxID=490096 RepID=A0ABP9UM25_9BACT